MSKFLPVRRSSRKAASAAQLPVSIGVLIATYQRAEDLVACLRSLEEQTTPAKEIILVVRSDDSTTLKALDTFSHQAGSIRKVIVDRPGTVHARNAGLEAGTADIVTMLDDDTTAPPELLGRILKDFQDDPHLGGLGGRDRCYINGCFDDRQEQTVGKIQWFGRVIGNHHLGFGVIRPVDVLKGANMSFRAEAVREVRFDSRLKGTGAQPSEDYCFSISVKARGWALAYDPRAVVHHFPRERAEARQYVGVNAVTDPVAYRAYVYNDHLCTWLALTSIRRAAYLVWAFAIGTGSIPGILQGIRFTRRLGWQSWVRFFVAQQGRALALRDLLFRRTGTATTSQSGLVELAAPARDGD